MVGALSSLPILENESEVAPSCPTLCDPMDCSLRVSSIHGNFQAWVLEWVPFSFSRGSSPPRDWTQVSSTANRHFYCLSSWCLAHGGHPINMCWVKEWMNEWMSECISVRWIGKYGNIEMQRYQKRAPGKKGYKENSPWKVNVLCIPVFLWSFPCLPWGCWENVQCSAKEMSLLVGVYIKYLHGIVSAQSACCVCREPRPGGLRSPQTLRMVLRLTPQPLLSVMPLWPSLRFKAGEPQPCTAGTEGQGNQPLWPQLNWGHPKLSRFTVCKRWDEQTCSRKE